MVQVPLTDGPYMDLIYGAIIALLVLNMWITWKIGNEIGTKVIQVAKELDNNIGLAVQNIVENGLGGGEAPNLLQGLAVEWFRGLKEQKNSPRGENGRFIQAEIIEPGSDK